MSNDKYPDLKFEDSRTGQYIDIVPIRYISYGINGITVLYKNTALDSNELFILKFFYPIRYSNRDPYLHEIYILKKLSKMSIDNIIKFRGFIELEYDPSKREHNYLLNKLKYNTSIYQSSLTVKVIITDFIEGMELFDFINMEYYVDVLCVYNNLLKIIKDLHSNGITHSDVKLENIIYDDKNNKVTLIDFGSANFFNQIINNEHVGVTKSYVPHRFIDKSDKTEDDYKYLDLYSFMVTIYIILTTKFPLEGDISNDYDEKYCSFDLDIIKENINDNEKYQRVLKICKICDTFFEVYKNNELGNVLYESLNSIIYV